MTCAQTITNSSTSEDMRVQKNWKKIHMLCNNTSIISIHAYTPKMKARHPVLALVVTSCFLLVAMATNVKAKKNLGNAFPKRNSFGIIL